MISHEHKIIFLHLPKCGGTSIEVAITGKAWHEKDLWPHQHLTAKETKKCYGEEIFNSYFKFAFVRNTWDLLVSYYLWGCWGKWGNLERWFRFGGKWGHPHRLGKLIIGKLPTFEDYLSNIYDFNVNLNFNLGNMDLTHQMNAISIDGNIAVDFIGRFENLQRDFNLICHKTGIQQQNLRRIHKSNRKKHYSEFYNPETKNIVARKYKKDIAFFDFMFEDVSS